MVQKNIAVVTGASSGIGAATARRLAAEGFHVVAAARRADRLDALVEEIGPDATAVDVRRHLGRVGGRRWPPRWARWAAPVTLLVNNAGGARGLDPVETGSVADWQWMYDVNVLGTLRVTKALLPALEASGAGTIVTVGSTAAFTVYEGGGGYTAAKHAQNALVGTLRLELSGRPVRVIEIDPGMVRTDEFSLNRFGGDQAKADAIYAGVAEPLVADDIADCIAWCATRPQHVNIDRLVVRPIAQAAQHKVAPAEVMKPLGAITRGTTNPNRLRRVDNFIAYRCGGSAARARAEPLVVDLGYGATPVTAVELRGRLAAAVRADVAVVGLEIDPVRVSSRPAVRRPAAAGVPPRRFRAGRPAPASWCARSTCCASTPRTRSPRPGGTMTATGALLVEGTCDELGRIATWAVVERRRRRRR